MSKSNPQDAMVGDLIMWTSNYGGFSFGKIISFNSNGVPMVRPIRDPWVQTRRKSGKKYFSPSKYGTATHSETGEKGYWFDEYEDCNEPQPLGYSGGHQAGYNWMVISYGPNNPKARTVTEEHPIAKARRQFAELESGVKGPF